jgi:mono/diheme cytochrome c family protein
MVPEQMQPAAYGRVLRSVFRPETENMTTAIQRLGGSNEGVLARHKRTLLWLFGLLLVLMAGAAGLGWWITEPRPAFAEADAASLEQGGDPARGKDVFDAADCASCHASPGQPDRQRLGGGLSLPSQFGTFFPPNISPDPNDGIGRWRTIDLANALMSGVSPQGEHIYPALPYTSYAHMRVEDVKDLMAYLRRWPAGAGPAPAHDLPFPFTIRRMVGVWKFLYLDRSPIQPDPARDEAWNRGRYLVEALGHCAECHSARNMLGAIKSSSRLAGGQDQEGIGFVPNITQAGIGDWSSEDIVEALTSGHTPQLRRIGSSMADVVTDTAALKLSDRQAIAAYIRSVPARSSPDAVKER